MTSFGPPCRPAAGARSGKPGLRRSCPCLLLLIAGCSAGAPPPDRSRALGVCTAVVAEHVRKPEAALTATWAGTTEIGIGVVRVVDEAAGGGERVHRCELDAAGRARAVLHVAA